MIFAVFDPSPLTVCINCSFLHLYIEKWSQKNNLQLSRAKSAEIITRREAVASLNLGETLRRVLTAFMRPAITPPKVNRFGKFLENVPILTTSGRKNSAMITDRRQLTAKINLYGMSSFHFYRWNQIQIFPLGSTLKR